MTTDDRYIIIPQPSTGSWSNALGSATSFDNLYCYSSISTFNNNDIKYKLYENAKRQQDEYVSRLYSLAHRKEIKICSICKKPESFFRKSFKMGNCKCGGLYINKMT